MQKLFRFHSMTVVILSMLMAMAGSSCSSDDKDDDDEPSASFTPTYLQTYAWENISGVDTQTYYFFANGKALMTGRFNDDRTFYTCENRLSYTVSGNTVNLNTPNGIEKFKFTNNSLVSHNHGIFSPRPLTSEDRTIVAKFSGEDDENEVSPETPSTPNISESAFIGIWKIEDHVFELKSNGSLGYYWLTSYYSNTYRDYSDGTWSFDKKTSTLVLIRKFPHDGSTYESEFIVKEVSNDYFTISTGDKVTRQSSLPEKEQSTQSNQLAGTNWSARIDGDYVELSFKNNGTFTEIYAGEKATSTYTELDKNTIIIGDGTVMSNTFGENPFHFELNSNKTKVTFSGIGEKWTFNRKQ